MEQHPWLTVRDIENQLDEIQIPIGSPQKTSQIQPKKQNNIPLIHWLIQQSKSAFAHHRPYGQ
jgi:hypothetical protein